MAKNPLIAKLTKHRHECQWRIPAFPEKVPGFIYLDAGAMDTFCREINGTKPTLHLFLVE